MGTEANFVENAPLLAAEKLVVGYTRDIDILRDLSCKVWPGRISCVVGANGTGKSTLLKALFGFLKPHSGRVLLSGRDVTGTLPYVMLGLGVAYLPQRPSLFPHLTVESNLKLGLWHARPPKALRAGSSKRLMSAFRSRARSGISPQASSPAGSSARSRSPAA